MALPLSWAVYAMLLILRRITGAMVYLRSILFDEVAAFFREKHIWYGYSQ